MAEILLVNPRRRRKHHKARRKNPRRHRRHRNTSHRRHRRRNPAYRFHRRHRRRNPGLLGGGGGIVGTLMSEAKSGFVGATGALGLDLLWGYGSSYLPSALNTGYVQYLSKALGAVLIGFIGGKVMRGKGRDLAVGAMTVVIHDALKTTLSGMGVPLGAYVGTSPIVAYGAPAVGVPQLGTRGLPMAPNGVPQARQMGFYESSGMSGYGGTAYVEGTEY